MPKGLVDGRRCGGRRGRRLGPRSARRCGDRNLALLALASFEAVTPLPSVSRELTSTLAARRRIL
jgi:hypothetical protein